MSHDSETKKPAAVVLDASKYFEYPRDVRPETQPPPPPHKEIAGDAFDRQRVMVSFNQGLIEQTVAFILGTGGLGQSVAFALCRMGVAKIILLDMDTFEASNLNRQICGTKDDIGRRKVDVAESGLKVHNLRTEIVKMHMDAVTKWDKVVEAARSSTVLFNCIDYGAVFDFAANSLSKELKIPYVSGSSYAFSMIMDFFTGQPGKACWACMKNTSESFENNENDSKDLAEWASKRSLSLLNAADLAAYHAERVHMHDTQTLMQELLNARNQPDGIKLEEYSKFLKQLRVKVEEWLLPSRILSHKSISFIPKDKHAPTRDFGSWVCVCTGTALLMVNAFVQHTRGEHKFPNYALITLTNVTANNSTQDGADGLSDKFCITCKDVNARFLPPLVAPVVASEPVTTASDVKSVTNSALPAAATAASDSSTVAAASVPSSLQSSAAVNATPASSSASHESTS